MTMLLVSENVLRVRLRKRQAFAEISAMCFDQDRSLDMTIPRSLIVM